MVLVALLALSVASQLTTTHLGAIAGPAPIGFVRTDGDGGFVTESGGPFRFAGTNCYYLSYEKQDMVDDVFQRAVAHNFSVLRTWAFLDIGFANGTGSVGGSGAKNGVAFQYFDEASNGPVVNTTALAHLDAVVATAARYGVKLLLTLTNNWVDFGGLDQYVRWLTWSNATYAASGPLHDDAYTHPQIRAWYQAWVRTLLTRVNTLTGVAYKDDPTIFGWELANEPRCQGSGAYPSSNNCTLDYAKYGKWPVAWKITGWAAEMGAFVKSIDSKHLLAVGDEGWGCQPYQECPNTACDCYFGVDNANLTALPSVDFMSAHLYPSNWGHAGSDGGAAWGAAWIANHTARARTLGKPFVLGEFGADKQYQPSAYTAWGAAALASGTAGDLFWMLSGRETDGGGDNGWYPNYDGLGVYCPNATDPAPPSGANPATCGVLAAHAAAMAGKGA